MQISGLRYGRQLLELVEFPVAEIVTGSATKNYIQKMQEKENFFEGYRRS